MEFTLTFLAVERFDYAPSAIAKMFLLIGFTLILASCFKVFQSQRFSDSLVRYGEKTFLAVALIGIVIESLPLP